MTTRDELAKRQKFEPVANTARPDGTMTGFPDCIACGRRRVKCDRDTGLCRPCWRVWRFAARIHQFGEGMPAINFGVATGASFKADP